jgi:hypothetical protein
MNLQVTAQIHTVDWVALWLHETVQGDIANCLVDGEYIDSECFGEYIDGVCCSSLEVIVVAVMTEHEAVYL